MSEPSPLPDPAPGLPPGATPYLLVMPSAGDGSTITWPGAEGQPAWAIPVIIPAGTQGYAIFVPLQPAAGSAAPAIDTSLRPVVAEPEAIAPVAVEMPEPVRVVPEPAVDEPAIAGLAPEPDVDEPAIAGLAPAADRSPVVVLASAIARDRSPYYAQPGTFLADNWPGPPSERGWGAPAAVLFAGLGVATFTPLGRSGIGWVLAGLVLTAAVLQAVWQAGGGQEPAERRMRLVWTVAALALLTVPTFRNAWWLVDFSIIAALGCAALAIVGGTMVRSILYSLVAAPFAALRGIPWVARHLEIRRREDAPTGVLRRVVLSVIVTALVVVVFGSLLMSADAAFSKILRDNTPVINGGTVFDWSFLWLFGALTAVAAVYTITAPPRLSRLDRPGNRTLGVVDWGLPIAGLVVLFAGFVAVQFTVLFGGARHVLATVGLSYADYARSGFWQLAAVTVLTLAVLGGVTRWARRSRPSERMGLRILLGLLCALSFVIVVSALYRMYTYQKVYSFTGERIFVMAFELLLGTIFLMIMAAGIRLRGAWIPSMTVGLAVVMLLSLAVLNPEDYAARRNIERYQTTGKIDAWYIRALSADATPALTQLPDAVRRCALSWIAPELQGSDPWYAWNLGRMQARDALAKLDPGSIGGYSDCRAADQFDLPKTRN